MLLAATVAALILANSPSRMLMRFVSVASTIVSTRGNMAGTDTIRGIAYQQAHAIHLAIELAEQRPEHQLRVEGTDDVVDVEVLDAGGRLVGAHQMKSHSGIPWTPKPIADVARRWVDLNEPAASFTFITNGALGPGAQALSDALTSTAPDRIERLARELGISEELAGRLEFARIRVDPSSVGVLLAAAERRIAARLDPLERDREEAAVQRVDTMFRVLMERAAHKDPAKRLLTANEIRTLVGGEYGERSEFQWSGPLKTSYMAAVTAVSPVLVPLTLTEHGGGKPVAADTLLQSRAASLSGPTGTGKSSAVQILQSLAALAGRAVVVCRAETYVPGQLGALVADSLGFSLGSAVPTYAGRKVLADPDAVVVVDGVSEIPDATLEHLANDIKPFLNRPGFASIVLVGRDPTVLRRVVDAAPAYEEFSVTPLAHFDQETLIKSIVGSEAETTQIRARAERVLGDGARNPMLLTIFLEAGTDGTLELSRSEVYERFLSHLSSRAPSVDAGTYLPVLGVVFTQLLSTQRRYSDRYEWVALTDVAAASLGASITGESTRAAALRIGLVTEVGVGVLAPFHDSLADYLAGTAVAAGIASLPPSLRATQSEWVIFASELGVDVSLGVARDLPFLSVRAGRSDDHFPGSSAYADQIAKVLATLLGTSGCTVDARQALDGRWILRAADSSGVALGAAVVDAERGPLYAATRLWRLVLRSRFNDVRPTLSTRPQSLEDAQTRVKTFARQRQHELDTLLNTFPDDQRSQLLERLRPLGVSFFIGEREETWGTDDWRMTYVASVETRLLDDEPEGRPGHTSATHYLDGGPAHAAAKDIRKAVEELTDTSGWLS